MALAYLERREGVAGGRDAKGGGRRARANLTTTSRLCLKRWKQGKQKADLDVWGLNPTARMSGHKSSKRVLLGFEQWFVVVRPPHWAAQPKPKMQSERGATPLAKEGHIPRSIKGVKLLRIQANGGIV
eukprot:scaffold3685_cov242-Pinguiococcus_pyrenoidosus.AAC.13